MGHLGIFSVKNSWSAMLTGLNLHAYYTVNAIPLLMPQKRQGIYERQPLVVISKTARH